MCLVCVCVSKDNVCERTNEWMNEWKFDLRIPTFFSPLDRSRGLIWAMLRIIVIRRFPPFAMFAGCANVQRQSVQWRARAGAESPTNRYSFISCSDENQNENGKPSLLQLDGTFYYLLVSGNCACALRNKHKLHAKLIFQFIIILFVSLKTVNDC